MQTVGGVGRLNGLWVPAAFECPTRRLSFEAYLLTTSVLGSRHTPPGHAAGPLLIAKYREQEAKSCWSQHSAITDVHRRKRGSG